MTPQAWLTALIRASLEGGALLIVIWLATRLWPRMPAAARCGLWWVGALRMIVGLVPLPTIAVPWPGWPPGWVPVVPAPMLELGNAMAGAVAAPAVTSRPPVEWIPIVILALWLAGVGAGLVLLALRLLALRRTWRTAQPFVDPRVARWQGEWAVVLGKGRVPEVRIGADTRAPVAIGAQRPGLLLPAVAGALPDDSLRMVFAHEMSHVRRCDPLLGWVPAIAELLFWFHPLVRLAAREYLAAREQVCDADALRATGVPPRDYGALLLDFGVVRTSEVPVAASCASRRSRDLKRRIEMLSRNLSTPVVHRVGAAAIVLAVLALGFAPIRFVAAYESGTPSKSSEGKRELDKRHAGKRERPPFAYLIKIEDREGTRGSVDMSDLEDAQRLEEENRTAVYFRLGDQRWVSYEPTVIEAVMDALRPESALEERQRVIEGRNQSYEQEQAKLELRRADLEQRKARLEERKGRLEEQIDSRREAGRSDDDLKNEQGAIEEQMHTLWDEERGLLRVHQQLAGQMRRYFQSDKALVEEMNRAHVIVLEEVSAIARRAIAAGQAERFMP